MDYAMEKNNKTLTIDAVHVELKEYLKAEQKNELIITTEYVPLIIKFNILI